MCHYPSYPQRARSVPRTISREIEEFVSLPHVKRALQRLLDGHEKIQVTYSKDGKEVVIRRLE